MEPTKRQRQQDAAEPGPVQPLIRCPDGEEIEHPSHPDFAEVVRVAAVAEEPGCDERTLDFFAGRELPLLVLLKRPHLLVGDGFADEQDDEQGRGDAVDPGERGAPPEPCLVRGRREEPDQEHLPKRDEREIEGSET